MTLLLLPLPGPAARSTLNAPAGPAAWGGVASGISVVTVAVGVHPEAVIYDSATGDMYVPNYYSANVTLLHGAQVVGSVDASLYSSSGVYDPGNGYVYVCDLSGEIDILSGTTLVQSLPTGAEPHPPAYDAANGYIYVPNFGSDNVTVLDGTREIASVPVGSQPSAAAVDPSNGLVYIPNSGGSNVSVLNGTRVVASVPVGAYPTSVGIDPTTGYAYVPSTLTRSVDVLDGLEVIARIPVGSGPGSIAYDRENGDLYVPNLSSNNVSVIHGETLAGSVATLRGPEYVVCDDANGEVFVTDLYASSVSVLSGTSVVAEVLVGTLPGPPAYDPMDQGVYVPDEDANNVSILLGPESFPVNLTEAGLPAGTGWTATLGGVPRSTDASSLGWTETNGSYPFAVVAPVGFSVVPSSGTVTVDGAGVAQHLAFTALPTTTYAVTFVAVGLPAGDTWGVTLGNRSVSGSGPLRFDGLANGSYPFTVPSAAGLRPVPASGTLNVTGNATTEDIVFLFATSPLGGPSPSVDAVVLVVLVAVVLAAVLVWRERRSDALRRPPIR